MFLHCPFLLFLDYCYFFFFLVAKVFKSYYCMKTLAFFSPIELVNIFFLDFFLSGASSLGFLQASLKRSYEAIFCLLKVISNEGPTSCNYKHLVLSLLVPLRVYNTWVSWIYGHSNYLNWIVLASKEVNTMSLFNSVRLTSSMFDILNMSINRFLSLWWGSENSNASP